MSWLLEMTLYLDTTRRSRLPMSIFVLWSLVFPLQPRTSTGLAAQYPSNPVPAQASSSAGSVLTECTATASRTDVEQAALPKSSGDLLRLLTMCRDTAQTLIAEGRLGFVFLPAMEGKDIALALEDHLDEIPASKRQDASSAVRRLVVAAWRLDADGDLGNKERLSASYMLFATAISDLLSVYGTR